MKTFKILILITLMKATILFANDVSAPAMGKQLHNEKCSKCHTTSVYSRLDRVTNSHEALLQRVTACVKNAVREDWSPDQIQSVVEYLDKEFYEF